MPEPTGKTAAELETLTGVAPERLRAAVKAGLVPRAKSGRYSLAGTLVGLIKFQERLLSQSGGLPIYDSMNQCAGKTGLPLSVLKQLKKSGSDAFKWNRVALGPLLKDLFSGDTDKNWRGHFDKFHALREELRHTHEAGEALSKGEVHFAISKGTNLLFSILDRMANVELPPDLKGRDERGCQLVMVGAVEKAKQSFIESLGELGRNGVKR